MGAPTSFSHRVNLAAKGHSIVGRPGSDTRPDVVGTEIRETAPSRVQPSIAT